MRIGDPWLPCRMGKEREEKNCGKIGIKKVEIVICLCLKSMETERVEGQGFQTCCSSTSVWLAGIALKFTNLTGI